MKSAVQIVIEKMRIYALDVGFSESPTTLTVFDVTAKGMRQRLIFETKAVWKAIPTLLKDAGVGESIVVIERGSPAVAQDLSDCGYNVLVVNGFRGEYPYTSEQEVEIKDILFANQNRKPKTR